MTTRAPFLTETYGGYQHRDIPEEDAEITRVGPGTPCGEWMRRHWVPVAYEQDLGDFAKKIRILGENLVIYRDKQGTIGLLELQCSHRGSSLEFGIIGERGIKCCYHGWRYDYDGTILETPGEPEDSTLKDRLCHGAYPTQVHLGMVFAYMGPPELMPPLPVYDTFQISGVQYYLLEQHVFPCNWLQVKENCMDPAHLYFLHTTVSTVQFKDDLAIESEMDFMEVPTGGMVYIDTRRLGDKAWVRLADYVPPYIHQFLMNPPGERQSVKHAERTHWAVPVDDTHTMFMGVARLKEGDREPRGTGFGQTADRPYDERQRVPGDYDAQVSQRPIARHGMEHLGSTDRGIIMMRNLIRRSIRQAQGDISTGPSQDMDKVSVPTFSSGTVLPLEPAPTFAEDRQLLRDTGRRVAEEIVRERTS